MHVSFLLHSVKERHLIWWLSRIFVECKAAFWLLYFLFYCLKFTIFWRTKQIMFRTIRTVIFVYFFHIINAPKIFSSISFQSYWQKFILTKFENCLHIYSSIMWGIEVLNKNDYHYNKVWISADANVTKEIHFSRQMKWKVLLATYGSPKMIAILHTTKF